MRNISDLIREADEIIEKRASKKEDKPVDNDEITKLANSLMEQENLHQEKIASVSIEKPLQSVVEKLAHAVALVDTYINLEEFQKVADFEEKALEAGYSPEAIEQYVEKIASDGRFKTVMKALRIPLVASGAAGVTAGALGYGKGHSKGYVSALKDVDQALKQHSES